jgi:hypothetical protein
MVHSVGVYIVVSHTVYKPLQLFVNSIEAHNARIKKVTITAVCKQYGIP